MLNAPELLDQLTEDNYALTIRFLVKINSIHKTPRLRRKVLKISASQFESHLPRSGMRDLSYLLTGLMALGGAEIGPDLPVAFVRAMCDYLRTCESYGVSIGEFF